jgi:hypothetical protein
LVVPTSETPSQQLHLDQNSSEVPSISSHSPKNFLLGLFEMLRPGALTVICSLCRGSYPSLFILVDGGDPSQPAFSSISQSRLSLSTISRGFGLSVQGRIPPHSKYIPLLSQDAFFGSGTRPQRQSESHGRYLQSYFDKPHRWCYRKERRRKFLSFKHPPSMPSPLYILGLVRPSAPQEYRSTMGLGCKSVSGCPVPLFPFLSFSSFAQNAATALSCGTLSIFPRLTYRFAECEKNTH